MSNIQTLLFGLDGTLIDSIRLILDSYHHTLAVHGVAPRSDSEWLRGLGTPLRVQFQEWSHDAALLERMVATYREYNLRHHDGMVRRYEGIVEAIEAIRRAGRRTGVVTSKNREGTLRGLRLAGLADHFDVLVCADDVQHPKPHREPIDRAVRELAADPTTTVYVGDSVHDMHSGRAGGVLTAAVLWGPFGRPVLEPAQPDYWLETPKDILGLLGD